MNQTAFARGALWGARPCACLALLSGAIWLAAWERGAAFVIVAVLTYLVGELWRRVGDAKLASEWLNRVASEVVDAHTQQWVIDAARQQRDCPREWFG